MLVDFNDPESILSWWKVWPARHSNFLEYKLYASPEFAPAIREAQRRISADAALSALLADGVRESREFLSQRGRGAVATSAYQLRQREFAAEV